MPKLSLNPGGCLHRYFSLSQLQRRHHQAVEAFANRPTPRRCLQIGWCRDAANGYNATRCVTSATDMFLGRNALEGDETGANPHTLGLLGGAAKTLASCATGTCVAPVNPVDEDDTGLTGCSHRSALGCARGAGRAVAFFTSPLGVLPKIAVVLISGSAGILRAIPAAATLTRRLTPSGYANETTFAGLAAVREIPAEYRFVCAAAYMFDIRELVTWVRTKGQFLHLIQCDRLMHAT